MQLIALMDEDSFKGYVNLDFFYSEETLKSLQVGLKANSKHSPNPHPKEFSLYT